MTENPFSLIKKVNPEQNVVLTPKSSPKRTFFGNVTLREGEYEMVTEKGNLAIFKDVDGVQVLVKDLGSMRNRIERSILSAGLLSLDDLQLLCQDRDLAAIDRAAVNLAALAAEGGLAAIQEFYDRAIGKPKQTTENKNLNLTIDDVLAMEDDEHSGTNDTGENQLSA